MVSVVHSLLTLLCAHTYVPTASTVFLWCTFPPHSSPHTVMCTHIHTNCQYSVPLVYTPSSPHTIMCTHIHTNCQYSVPLVYTPSSLITSHYYVHTHTYQLPVQCSSGVHSLLTHHLTLLCAHTYVPTASTVFLWCTLPPHSPPHTIMCTHIRTASTVFLWCTLPPHSSPHTIMCTHIRTNCLQCSSGVHSLLTSHYYVHTHTYQLPVQCSSGVHSLLTHHLTLLCAHTYIPTASTVFLWCTLPPHSSPHTIMCTHIRTNCQYSVSLVYTPSSLTTSHYYVHTHTYCQYSVPLVYTPSSLITSHYYVHTHTYQLPVQCSSGVHSLLTHHLTLLCAHTRTNCQYSVPLVYTPSSLITSHYYVHTHTYQLPVQCSSGVHSLLTHHSPIMFCLSSDAQTLHHLTQVDKVEKLVLRIITEDKCTKMES